MFIVSSLSDIGIKKKVNQDSILVKKANSDDNNKQIVFAAVCDGMGGLANGELASSHLVSELNNWFDNTLPDMINKGISNNKIKESLTALILRANEVIAAFGEKEGTCGTTISAIFMYMNHYAVVNVGDSRVYKISNDEELVQITHDQSLVQDMIDKGKITEEQAKTHPQRSVLLQCVGAGAKVSPAYNFGEYSEGDLFILCSDGFRHKLKKEEIESLFNPKRLNSEGELYERIKNAIEINKQRQEQDNISVIAIKVKG